MSGNGEKMSITKSFNKTAITLGLLTAFNHQVTVAQDTGAQEDKGLEVIMVTAQKRVQNVKEVPISMTAVSQEKLLESNISTTEELSTYISNFSVSQSGQGFNVIMRGLGSGPNQGFEQTVGTFVDGIYRGRGHLMRSAFLDLERVEVLRGPQSALFGKNTTAGALNLTNAKPTEDFQAYINTDYNFTYNTTSLDGAVSNSITDNLQARIALKVVDGDGPFTNTVTNTKEVGHETKVARVSLAWQPTSDINVQFTAQRDEDKTTGYDNAQIYAEPEAYDYIQGLDDTNKDAKFKAITDVIKDEYSERTAPGLGEVDASEYVAEHFTLNVEYDMGNLFFTSITGLQEYDLKGSTDADRSVVTNVYRDRGDEKFSQLSQEFRLTSALDGAFNYIAGVYYQETDLDYDENYRVYPLYIDAEREFDVDSTTAAIFTQLDYQFSERFEATLGLRYSTEDKDGIRNLKSNFIGTKTPIGEIANIGPFTGAQWKAGVLQARFDIIDHNLVGDRSENSFTPSLNLKYKLDDAMFYASVATGAKAGGFDSRSNNDRDFEFDDESVTSFEIGSKLTLDDGLADINVAIFNMVFKDLQTSIYDGSVGFNVQNGGKATSRGIEVDGRWAFADNWLVSGSLGWLDFEWNEFEGAKCYNVFTTPDEPAAPTSCDLSGKTNAFAPKISGSVNLQYYTEVSDMFELKADLELAHKSSYYTNGDLNPQTKQGAATKVNARLSLLDIGGVWQVALLGKNLTDETIISFSNDMTLGPSTGGYYSTWLEPGRNVSLQFGYNFE